MDMWSVHWKENCEKGRQISELGEWHMWILLFLNGEACLYFEVSGAGFLSP